MQTPCKSEFGILSPLNKSLNPTCSILNPTVSNLIPQIILKKRDIFNLLHIHYITIVIESLLLAVHMSSSHAASGVIAGSDSRKRAAAGKARRLYSYLRAVYYAKPYNQLPHTATHMQGHILLRESPLERLPKTFITPLPDKLMLVFTFLLNFDVSKTFIFRTKLKVLLIYVCYCIQTS